MTDQKDGAPINVHISDPLENAKFKYPSNYIRTTKYTVVTFLPVNLFEQFHKLSNIFFAINMTLSLIPGIAPVVPITTVLPLIIVLTVAGIRDALEDYARNQADQKANSAIVTVVRDGQQIKVKSMDIAAGDIIYLTRGEQILCDCVLISTSIEDGTTYVETANLDGETNLKPKLSKTPLHTYFGSDLAKMKAGLKGRLVVDAPNFNLNKCEGQIVVRGPQQEIPSQPITIDNVLLRGCILRNCDFVYAIAVYTGVNTKLFLNLKPTAPKRSRLDLKLNKIIFVIFMLQQSLILIIASSAVSIRTEYLQKNFILSVLIDGESGGFFFIKTYMTYFVLFALMIPISLFVSMEFCKATQAKFMEWDVGMHTDISQMKARTSSLNEELSQIQYIFTDKTGTLTENKMLFAKCWISGQSYDELKNPGGLARQLRSIAGVEQAEMANFLKGLSLCNTVVIAEGEGGKLTYDGSSTDEVALVTCARTNGYTLCGRTSESISHQINNEKPITYKVETVLPFTAERKMMSIVLRDSNTDALTLITKGADSSIISNLDNDHPRNKEILPSAVATLKMYAEEGLRTLAFGTKEINSRDYAEWIKQWNTANLAMSDRTNLVHNACLAMEKGMVLMGCTAIEDKLQDEVAETIKFFLDAGIIIWVLTGDKRETAINIAGTSKLLDPLKDQLIILDNSERGSKTMSDLVRDAIATAKASKARNQKVSMIIDGRTIEAVEASAECSKLFEELSYFVTSAVCCRVTPIQKANVVSMFQKKGYTCLGIGDGANDVSMIQEAKVGIGVIGLEGSQAERASDYAIPRFRHLRRLLAVHGRYSLIRNSVLIQYSFYKNLAYCLTQFFFAFYNGFSGQTIYDSWVIVCYNMVFTLLPPLAMGLFEYDVRDDALLKHPELYGELRNPTAVRLSRATASLWAGLAIFQGICIFFGTLPWMENSDLGMWSSGTVLMTVIISIVMGQACVVFMSWTAFHFLSVFLSMASYLVFIFVYAVICWILHSTNYFMVPMHIFQEPALYLYICLWTFGLIGPEVAVIFIRRYYFATLQHQARRKFAKETTALEWMFSIVTKGIAGGELVDVEEEMSPTSPPGPGVASPHQHFVPPHSALGTTITSVADGNNLTEKLLPNESATSTNESPRQPPNPGGAARRLSI
jgi:phospholipid-transporting ATPase